MQQVKGHSSRRLLLVGLVRPHGMLCQCRCWPRLQHPLDHRSTTCSSSSSRECSRERSRERSREQIAPPWIDGSQH